jgi:hypothetical protein
MRHARLLAGALALAVFVLPVRVIEPAFIALLVSAPRRPQRLAPAALRARRRAVAMAAVARAAQEEDLPALSKHADYKAK